MSDELLRLIAFYLPQFHPVPENDEWWGAGFTEWANVVKARPLFRGHHQPHLPADLGFYDLRLPEARAAQADLARRYGVGAFCYYHYWFHGRRLLGRPFDEVLRSGAPDLPFCLCWANESWTRAWDGAERQVLVGQRYSPADDLAHVRWLLPAFADPRYVRVGGRPLFLIYRAKHLPDVRRTLDAWRDEARRAGAGELFLCRVESYPDERGDPRALGFDAAVGFAPDRLASRNTVRSKLAALRARARSVLTTGRDNHLRIYDYATVVRQSLAAGVPPYPYLPCAAPSWDNTARRKVDGLVVRGSTPALYEGWLRAVAAQAMRNPPGQRLAFVNGWNEWAEGNHLEPDARFGHGYLEATRRVVRAANGPAGAMPEAAVAAGHHA